MIDTYVELYLSKDPYYTYKQTLDDTDFILTFRYSTREACWYMDLADAEKTPIVLGTKIVAQYPLLYDYVIADLPGFFWLSPNLQSNVGKINTHPQDLPDYFTLRYFYEADEGTTV